jgi:glutamate carboxypeptidase
VVYADWIVSLTERLMKTRMPAMLLAALLCGALWQGSAWSAGTSRSKVFSEAQAVHTEQLQLLEQLVNIDSGTGDVAGGGQVLNVLIPRLRDLGMSIDSVPAEEPGLPPNTVATLTGSGKGRILMIGHIDTVFEPGTVHQRPYRADDKRAYGPGITDEKGGVVEGVYALQILRKLGFKDFKKIVFLLETSEERGSSGSRGIIGKLLTDADVELNLEPGDQTDMITVWRKGSATFEISVKGRAAHAGIAPQEGRNAAVELIHQVQGIDVFPHSGDGVTANLTVMHAGTRPNIIPEDAVAEINVRVRDASDFERVEAILHKNAQTTAIPDTTVTVTRIGSFYPPFPESATTKALATQAQQIYAAVGRKLETGGNGGASESGLAAAAGVPALDGLGPAGGGYHSAQEYASLDTVTPRLYLLTELLLELGAKPPVK